MEIFPRTLKNSKSMASIQPKLSFEQCKTLLGVSAEHPSNRGSNLQIVYEGAEAIMFEIDGLEVACIGHDSQGEVIGLVFNPYPETKPVDVVINWILGFSRPDLSHLVSHLLVSRDGETSRKKMYFRGWYVEVNCEDFTWKFNQHGMWGWSTYGWFVYFAGEFIEPLIKGSGRCLVSFETLLDHFLSNGYVLVNA